MVIYLSNVESLLQKILDNQVKMQSDITGLKANQERFEKKLDHFEKRLDGFEEKLNHFEKRLDSFEEKQNRFEEKLNRFENKLDAVADQVAELTVFRAKTTDILSKIDEKTDQIKFIKYKTIKNEEDIFFLKQSLKYKRKAE